ncbi:hypothetical protein [Ichthyobacterium seriolicida]|uniref:hypothetical protein n=1 Tax=Ichthyobacterium seriolicida TaxID=242600 RepID=UPI0012FDAC24|nr:hypothetical protein [Ichthyobacterium seriolicida]
MALNIKADILKLPDGAVIDVTQANFNDSDGSTDKHPATDPMTKFKAKKDEGIQFRVVAQDGKTATYYKLTFKEAAS